MTDALKDLELAGAIVIHPGDTLVLAFRTQLQPEQAECLKVILKSMLPAIEFIVIDQVAALGVLTGAQEAPR